jgi:DNA ligase-1
VRKFCALFEAIDATNRTREKVSALATYFRETAPGDAAWALFFLTGNRLPAPVKTAQLRNWVSSASGFPEWMVNLCYDRVGDLAETLALLLPPPDEASGPDLSLQEVVEIVIQPMRDLEAAGKRELLVSNWMKLNAGQRFVFNKLITGAFRMGVQRTLVVRGLSEAVGIEPAVLEHRLMGTWKPTAADFKRICDPETRLSDPEQPYPFYLDYPLEERSTSKTGEREEPDLSRLLGTPTEWQVEWKYDGIRAQLIRRKGQTLLWSRGEEGLQGRFPEIENSAASLPDGIVLDGEVVGWKSKRPLPFAALQKRIGKRNPSRKLVEGTPCIFMAYDCLERGGRDLREAALDERRKHLEQIFSEVEIPGRREVLTGRSGDQMEFGNLLLEEAKEEGRSEDEPALQCAPILEADDWVEYASLRASARDRGVEGLMLKRKGSVYGVGRTKGSWWKWKSDPFTIDAVLVYSQAGHGRRAGLDTDFTFAVWDQPEGGELVPICKAYSGLTDEEFRRINRWIQKNTLGRQGPVRMVVPEQVFEIAFEGINRSSRHKSGLAFRFPRMSRWRQDKKAVDADSLATVRALLPEEEPTQD